MSIIQIIVNTVKLQLILASKSYLVSLCEKMLMGLFGHISEKVAPYKKLRGGVEAIAEIPKTPSGKILRRVLKVMAAEKQESAS